MAKKEDIKEKEGKETVEFFKELDRDALQTEKFFEKHAKTFAAVIGALVLLAIGYFAYYQYVIVPKNDEAALAFLRAQKALNEGDEKAALGKKGSANPGFIGTFDNYSATDAGKLSAYNAGILKFREGKFSEAYDLLDKFKSSNKILMAMKYGAMADCKANMNKTEDALSLLDKAIAASGDPYTECYFTRKAGMLSLSAKKKEAAKKYFSKIEEKYSDYDNGMSDAYIEMVKYY